MRALTTSRFARSFARLGRNPFYWGRRSFIEEIQLRFYPDETALITALRNGEIDYALPVGPEEFDELDREIAEGRNEMAERQLTFLVGAIQFALGVREYSTGLPFHHPHPPGFPIEAESVEQVFTKSMDGVLGGVDNLIGFGPIDPAQLQ
mgnify:CR=1 FL=1